MKIAKQDNRPAFKALIPKETLKALARQNTRESRKLLHSCLGFNAVYRGSANVNPDKISRQMQDKFHINTDFGNNPIVAAFSALTANIFHKLGLAKPTNIFLKDLSGTWHSQSIGVCAVHPYDNDLYRKFGVDFPLRSVIMNENFDWYSLQEKMLYMNSENHLSTGHFLAPFIHEFVHSAHLDNLMKKYGNGSKIMGKFQREFTNKNTISMIKKETSDYGSTKPCEFIAEEMTELITDSLDPRTIMPNEMIFKMARLKEPFSMDRLITACWNGDVAEVEKFRKAKNRLISFLLNNCKIS